MKSIFILIMAFSIASFSVYGQENLSVKQDRGIFTNVEWAQHDTLLFIPQLWFYSGEYFFELRYNYEDINTISWYAGRSFTSDKKISYEILPLAGVSFGKTLSISLGQKMLFEYKNLSFESEGQFTFNLKEKNNSFLYNRSAFSYWFTEYTGIGAAHQLYSVYGDQLLNKAGPIFSLVYKSFDFQFAVLEFSKDEMMFYMGLGYLFPDSFRQDDKF